VDVPGGPELVVSVCFEIILLVSLCSSFEEDFLTESRLARRPSGMALATTGEDDPFSPCSVTFASSLVSSTESSCWDHSPAMTGGKRLITIRGVAETEEKRSIDSSYFFCSNRANAFK